MSSLIGRDTSTYGKQTELSSIHLIGDAVRIALRLPTHHNILQPLQFWRTPYWKVPLWCRRQLVEVGANITTRSCRIYSSSSVWTILLLYLECYFERPTKSGLAFTICWMIWDCLSLMSLSVCRIENLLFGQGDCNLLQSRTHSICSVEALYKAVNIAILLKLTGHRGHKWHRLTARPATLINSELRLGRHWNIQRLSKYLGYQIYGYAKNNSQWNNVRRDMQSCALYI